jgi:GTP:adenosylcobinamide-phosphate guanylyltransferase
LAGVIALLLAGRRPGVDPFAAAYGVELKALIPVAGTPTVVRVAATLLACPEISAIRVLTQDVAAIGAVVPADPRLVFERSGDGIASSIAGVASAPAAIFPMLITTADHALLTPATVAAFLAASGGCDIAVGVVERRVVERRFPTTKRTWLHFRGGSWTGANLFVLNGPEALPVVRAWSSVEQDRKKGWKLIARFGPLLLLRALTRTITVQAAAAQAGRSLGVRVRAVPLSDPLAAVDVDKHADLELAEAVLSGRA